MSHPIPAGMDPFSTAYDLLHPPVEGRLGNDVISYRPTLFHGGRPMKPPADADAIIADMLAKSDAAFRARHGRPYVAPGK